MNKYSYTAVTLNGLKTKGVIEATNFIDARKQLNFKDLRIISLKEKSEISFSIKRKKLKLNNISHFCKQFATVISSGINNIKALETLSKTTENKSLARELNTIVDNLKNGSTLSNEMLEKNSKFPNTLGAMVEIGEKTNTLPEMLNTMSAFYEKEHNLNKKIRNVSRYFIMMGIVYFIAILIFVYFISKKVLLLLNNSDKFTKISSFIASTQPFLTKWWWVIPTIIFISILLLLIYTKTNTGKLKKDIIISKTPVIGKLVRNLTNIKFVNSLYLFISTNYPLQEGLDCIKEEINNEVARKSIEQMKENFVTGESLGEILKKQNYFDEVLIEMISIGEETNNLECTITKLSDFYEYKSDEYLDKIKTTIKPKLTLVAILIAVLYLLVFKTVF